MINKVAVVTGAAQGIGREIALQLAKDGFDLAVCDKDKRKLDSIIPLIKEENQTCLAYELDVSKRDEVFRVIDEVVSNLGRLDVMVSNAGIVQVKPISEINETDLDRMFSVNVYGTLYCIQAATKHMLKQKSGKIINASSTSGKRGVEFLGHYAATKFGVIGLTQSAAKELAPYGITVNAYCPGIVGTGMWEEIDRQMANYLGVPIGETLNNKIKSIPLDRLEEPSDVAGLVSYLASEKANYMTGQAVVIDGGNVFS